MCCRRDSHYGVAEAEHETELTYMQRQNLLFRPLPPAEVFVQQREDLEESRTDDGEGEYCYGNPYESRPVSMSTPTTCDDTPTPTHKHHSAVLSGQPSSQAGSLKMLLPSGRDSARLSVSTSDNTLANSGGGSDPIKPRPNLREHFKRGLSRKYTVDDPHVPEHIKSYDTTWSEGAMAVDDISCIIFPLAYALVILSMVLENPAIFTST